MHVSYVTLTHGHLQRNEKNYRDGFKSIARLEERLELSVCNDFIKAVKSSKSCDETLKLWAGRLSEHLSELESSKHAATKFPEDCHLPKAACKPFM